MTSTLLQECGKHNDTNTQRKSVTQKYTYLGQSYPGTHENTSRVINSKDQPVHCYSNNTQGVQLALEDSMLTAEWVLPCHDLPCLPFHATSQNACVTHPYTYNKESKHV